MKTKLLLLSLSLVFAISCTKNTTQEEEESIDSIAIVPQKFPEVKSIESFPNTEFVLALEEPFNSSKNIVYAPTVLLAWDELKKAYHTSTFFAKDKDQAFQLLNDTKSHLGALDSNEYTVEIKKNGNRVGVRTYFNKSLPFLLKMESFDNFVFKKDTLHAFGFEYQDWAILDNIRILYYKNDNEFMIRLTPKDTLQEIILVKGDRNSKNFKEALKFYTDKKEKGIADFKNEKTKWKTAFMPGDVMRIPCLQFNLEKKFKNLMGKSYTDDYKVEHTLELLYQRNAFVLNERGAEMESEAYAVDTTAVVPGGEEEIELPKPKNLLFNEDFFVFVKKVKSPSPYYAIKITNTELMEKSK